MAGEKASKLLEWKTHWTLVLTAFVGFGLPVVAMQSIGLFIQPLQDEFGWNRTQITAGQTLAGVMTVFLSPFVGALIDKWGVRRLAVPGLALTSCSMAAMALANGSFVQWLALWTVYGFVGLLIKTTIWTKAVSSTFEADRGLALAVALCGTAFAQAVTPPLTRWLADTYGWREAYLILGFGWGLPSFLLAWLFLSDAQDRQRQARDAGADAAPAPPVETPGLSVADALRSRALWAIGISTLLTMTLGTGLLIHKVPMLTEAGVSRETAAYLAGLGGVAGILGKLVTGWLLDRFPAGIVGFATLAANGLAVMLLLEPFRTPDTIVISMFAMGYTSGTKLQICVFLTAQYAGMLNFGKIFGVMASILALAGGLGPMLASISYDLTGSYNLFIMVTIPFMFVSSFLLLGLGRLPTWETERLRQA